MEGMVWNVVIVLNSAKPIDLHRADVTVVSVERSNALKTRL
jgi:hypothetical protein